MYWLVWKSLSSYVNPSFRFDHQLRGLIWLKLALRTYSLTADAPKLMAAASPTAHDHERRAPHTSRSADAPGGASHHCTPTRALTFCPPEAEPAPTGERSVSPTL